MSPDALLRILAKIQKCNETAYRGLVAVIRSMAEALGV
jgi:hypothetical protein